MRRGAALVVALAALALPACTSSDHPGTGSPTGSPTSSPTGSSAGSSAGSQGGSHGGPRVVGTVARDLQVPWGIAFLPGGDAVVTERDTKRVLRIDGTTHRVSVIATFADPVDPGAAGESGLLGVAVSPDFATDHLLFFYETTTSGNRIVEATYDGGRLGPLRTVLDGIPAGFIHDGGRLAFGPDGYLYASTGETGDSSLAQDKGSLGGKILRITTDGEAAPGNPFGSPVWSYGHRNVEGLAFDDAGRLWASEFGQDTWDELNLIRPGRDYGWPLVEGKGGTGGLVDPQLVWPTDQASPSGLAWLDGHLWLAALHGARLWRVDVTGARAHDPRAFFVGAYGRLRTVVVAPDGMLWVTTSNRDGRGSPVAGDDRILLVDPT
ncbi:PQQ-dependent sugar dehydrogenase [Nocardioides panaciterrulae]|uniref:Glucose/arabinose dehydrogenase n=1 Tax=Nocardioides panaciterrulae TaxID=661492 RepID=A0A7Y9E7E1_9ACTN|nr:PQQ-dependent sugar dehydrogenase [Nocardioides panaciterrulae]NYD42525.1 glucose/arabinose dehydrogenase [Nocardioides panaciterrulae]